jgi:O-antigen ligase
MGAFFKFFVASMFVAVVLYNVYPVLEVFIGQNIFRRNVFSRFELFAFALEIIPEAPLFGSGAMAAENNGVVGEIHNTFLSMAVKSGTPAAVLMAITIFSPVILFVKEVRLAFFVVAVCLAMFTEHFFYPGRFNEYQIICFMVAKLSWQYYRSVRQMKTAMWQSG